jgi:hypothetical protein
VGIGPTLFGYLVQCGIGGAENAGPENAGPENDGPNWSDIFRSCIFHPLFFFGPSAGNIPCGSEVGHQISKGSVKRFKSYHSFKNANKSML